MVLQDNEEIFSFINPVMNGFAPVVLGRDIGITQEEIQKVFETISDNVGLNTSRDQDNITDCMKRLKLLLPVSNKSPRYQTDGCM
jgi:hypothetical protein